MEEEGLLFCQTSSFGGELVEVIFSPTLAILRSLTHFIQ